MVQLELTQVLILIILRVWTKVSICSYIIVTNLLDYYIVPGLCKNMYKHEDVYLNKIIFFKNVNHVYYTQMVAQMGITERNWCDLLVYTKLGSIVIRLPFDEDRWMELLNVVTSSTEISLIQCCVKTHLWREMRHQ